jgi:putative Mg2+ transporter-C (MgtC) family protein
LAPTPLGFFTLKSHAPRKGFAAFAATALIKAHVNSQSNRMREVYIDRFPVRLVCDYMSNPWLQWWTDKQPLLSQGSYPHLLLSLVLGAVIGSERQWRQRAAGLRTTTLVCFGSAAFVDLGATVLGAHSNSVIAYVVSGVGFLGAGAIMKEGGSIRGLNTAATLWCAAAVGACAGAGEMLDAVYATVLLVAINLTLRPISRWVDRRSIRRIRGMGVYRLMVTSAREQEATVSGAVMRALASRPLILRELRTEEVEGSDESFIEAVIESSKADRALITALVTELKTHQAVIGAEWAETSQEID